jgi:hypothetical protein
LTPPGLGLSVSLFIVSDGVAVEQGTQVLGVGGVTQPDQGLAMQLADAFPTEGHGRADGGEGAGRGVVEAIVSHDDGAEAAG